MLPIASASIVGGKNGVVGLLGVVGLAASLGFIGFIAGVRSGCPEPAGRALDNIATIGSGGGGGARATRNGLDPLKGM